MSNADPLLITDSDITGLLKNVYAKYRINAFPILTVLLAQVKKSTPNGPERMQWGGNGVFWDVKLTRPTGGSASDAGFLGKTSKAIEKQATLGIKRNYVTKHIDNLANVGTQSKDAAFYNIAQGVMDEAMDAATLFQQEQLHGDGRGIKAVLVSTADTTHFVAKDPYGLAGAGQAALWLDQDMFIAVLDSTGVTQRGTAFVTNVAQVGATDNYTFTLGSAIAGMAATDIVVAATASDNSFNQVTNGLLNITNRGAAYNLFEGINAGTFNRWNALNLVAGTDVGDASQPQEMDIYDLIRRVKGKSGKDGSTKKNEFLLLSTPGVIKKIGESFLGQREFQMVDENRLKGGFAAVNVCGLPMVEDADCPAGTIYYLHTPSLTWVDRMDWTKLQYEGSGPVRFIAGRDASEVTLASYWNFGALQRNSHGVITGYTDTARYTRV